MSATDGGQAFPGRKLSHYVATADGGADPVFVDSDGMSLRDWFAGQAMAAIIAKLPLFGHMSDAADISIAVDSDGEASIMGEVARGAFGYADAMLAERSKP